MLPRTVLEPIVAILVKVGRVEISLDKRAVVISKILLDSNVVEVGTIDEVRAFDFKDEMIEEVC